MSRRESAPKVTLFPFLAVLVCTMGALILLLVVTTRRIRQEALARAEQSAQLSAAVKGEQDGRGPIVPLFAEEETHPPAPLTDAGAEQLAPAERAPLPPDLTRQARIEQMIAERDAEAQRLRREWESRIADLMRRRQDLAASLRGVQGEVQQANTLVEQTRNTVAEYEMVAGEAVKQEDQTRRRLSEMLAINAELTARMKSLEEELARLQAALPERPKIEFVAQDVATGTNRRPILIECREDGILFASENVFVSAEQLSGSTPERNPVLAGTQALIDYWTGHDGPDQPGPYVLLVVRAKGTIGFYVARKLLDQLKDPYGYELVEDGREVNWPAADPQAAEACRRAVQQALVEQRQLAGRGYGRRFSGEESLQFSAPDGSFRLAEVDQLREPKEQIFFGDQAWSRPRRNTTSGPSELGNPTPGWGTPGTGPRRESSADRKGVAAPSISSSDSSRRWRPPSPKNDGELADTPSGDGRSDKTSEVVHAIREGREQSSVPPRRAGPWDAGASGPQGRRRLPFDATPPPGSGPTVNSAGIADDGGENRRWGEVTRGGTIGIERKVTLDLRTSTILVDDALQLDIPPALTRAELQQRVAQGLDAEARTWGAPPTGFCWRPAIKVVVHPGGNAHLARLTELFKHWGLKWQTEQRLD